MRRAIEWLDTVRTAPGITQVSDIYALVLAVRSEALDAAELLVRKKIVVQQDGNVRAFLETLAEDIALLGRKAK